MDFFSFFVGESVTIIRLCLVFAISCVASHFAFLVVVNVRLRQMITCRSATDPLLHARGKLLYSSKYSIAVNGLVMATFFLNHPT